jgi:hypothetical protein
LAERISEGVSPQTSLARKKLVGDTGRVLLQKAELPTFCALKWV